jgi:hypothetical protein
MQKENLTIMLSGRTCHFQRLEATESVLEGHWDKLALGSPSPKWAFWGPEETVWTRLELQPKLMPASTGSVSQIYVANEFTSADALDLIDYFHVFDSELDECVIKNGFWKSCRESVREELTGVLRSYPVIITRYTRSVGILLSTSKLVSEQDFRALAIHVYKLNCKYFPSLGHKFRSPYKPLILAFFRNRNELPLGFCDRPYFRGLAGDPRTWTLPVQESNHGPFEDPNAMFEKLHREWEQGERRSDQNTVIGPFATDKEACDYLGARVNGNSKP